MTPTTLAVASALGLALGLRHAFEPDHLAAVAAMVTDSRSRGSTRPVRAAATVGALWGIGHTASLVVVAMVLAVLRAQMPEPVTMGLEIAVGLLLVGLAVHLVVRGDRDAGSREHPYEHPSSVESAPSLVRPVAVGLVHGLAGSGALIALVAASIDHPAARIAHIALFGAGSTIAMAAASGIAGIPVAALMTRPRLRRWLRVAAAALSATTGVVWIVCAATA